MSGFSAFLIHRPNFILPYLADVIWMTCPWVQLAWKVSQLQKSLVKPREEMTKWKYAVVGLHIQYLTFIPLCCRIHAVFMDGKLTTKPYLMMFSEHPTSNNFPVLGSIASLMHLPNFMRPYSALVMRMTCFPVQLAWKVSQLQNSRTKPVV